MLKYTELKGEFVVSSKNELLNRLDEKYPKLSKGQKKLTDYIKKVY